MQWWLQHILKQKIDLQEDCTVLNYPHLFVEDERDTGRDICYLDYFEDVFNDKAEEVLQRFLDRLFAPLARNRQA